MIWVLILTALALRISILQTRSFDPDEFQHLHSAHQIFAGEIPYRDYFEHHTPFMHVILAGLYLITGESPDVLFAARVVMLGFAVAILGLTFVLTRQLYGTDAGLFATLFLSYAVMFLNKTIETRPDLGAVTFWLGSMVFMIRGLRSEAPWKWHLLSGLSMGTAVMFSQKSLFGVPGLLLAGLYPFVDRRVGVLRRQHIGSMLALVVGMATPVLLTGAYFLGHQALRQFIYCNVVINAHWKASFSPTEYLKQMLQQNPFFPIMGLTGVLASLAGLRRSDAVRQGIYIPIACLCSVVAGLFIIPVPYKQYYLLFIPLLALFAGSFFARGLNFDVRDVIASGHRASVVSWLSTGSVFLFGSVGLIYSLNLSRPSVPNLDRVVGVIHLTPGLLYLALWMVVLMVAVPVYVLGTRQCAGVLVSIAMILHPLDQMVTETSRTEGLERQLRNVRFVMASTTSSEAVLDGWSGFGFMRPQAFYYSFLHREVRAMLSEQELSDDLIKSVRERNTKIVIYDSDVRALPQPTQDYIRSRYVPAGLDDLYVRKN
jgi:4-amino-4-deoxy-L-arabinose transferase-like glycosyltransferase